MKSAWTCRARVIRLLLILVLAVPALSGSQVGPPKAPPVQDVFVVNGEEHPIPSTIENLPLPVTAPAPQPFQAAASGTLFGPADSQITLQLGVVPAGQLLVIETAAGWCAKGNARSSHRMLLNTTVEGEEVAFNVAPAGVDVFARFSPFGDAEGSLGTTSIHFGGPVKVYADPETAVTVTFSRNTNDGDSSCSTSVAGNLVDLG